MDVGTLTRALIQVGEKGANIARTIRAEKELLKLLVEEKTAKEKNNRFVLDFKTLADVLIQETARHDLSLKFPGIEKNFHGEESNKFTNTLGETICVEVKATLEETSSLLERVLDGNRRAAVLLAEVVHAVLETDTEVPIKPGQHSLLTDNVGIWIDPIDSTAQYINGENGKIEENGLAVHGLQNVLILIGAFDCTTGKPIIGAVNQPFHKYDASSDRWVGQSVWGVSINELQINSLNHPPESQSRMSGGLVILSTSEDDSVKEALKQTCSITYAAGAGYKMLVTVLGLVDAYIITKNSTYKWDVCGPHAILRSKSGGVLNYAKALSAYESKNGDLTDQDIEDLQVAYTSPGNEDNDDETRWCNEGGIIVFSDRTFLCKILSAFLPK